MSIVIALAASREAVIGADRRAIAFLGSCLRLEEELYSGQIENDEKLEARARELGASLQICDEKEKIWRRGELLVGEVTEISPKLCRRRRIYLTPGASLQVDITDGGDSVGEDSGREWEGAGGEARIRAWGGVGCTVFGNRFAQKLASQEIARAGGRVSEALIRGILEKAGMQTASLSREHTVLHSSCKNPDARAALYRALEEDCQESGWRLCAPQ